MNDTLAAFQATAKAGDPCVAVVPVGVVDAFVALAKVARRTERGVITTVARTNIDSANIFPPTNSGLADAAARRIALLREFRAQHESAISALDEKIAAALADVTLDDVALAPVRDVPSPSM